VSDDLASHARAQLASEGITTTAWGNGPGDRYPPHAHDYDKVLVAVEGSITFRLTTVEVAHELRAGDRLDLPAGIVHAADVGRSGVRCLEGHLPAGALGRDPRRMADWALPPSAGPGPQSDRDGET
jgi:hypothetical protein